MKHTNFASKFFSSLLLLFFAANVYAQVPDYCVRNNNKLRIIKDGDGFDSGLSSINIRDHLQTAIFVMTTGTCPIGTHWISTQVNQAAADFGLPIIFVYKDAEAHSGNRVQKFYSCGVWGNFDHLSKLTSGSPSVQLANAEATASDLGMPNTTIMIDDGFVQANFGTVPNEAIVKMVLLCGNPYFVDLPGGCSIYESIGQVWNGFQGPGGGGVGNRSEGEFEFIPEFEVFPNPASGYVTIQGAGDNVAIYDATGRLVKSLESVNGFVELDTEDLANGLYMVRSGDRVERLVVNH